METGLGVVQGHWKSGSALEVVLHDYALYKSTFTLLYFTLLYRSSFFRSFIARFNGVICLPCTGTPVRKQFTAECGQMQRRGHYMIARGLKISGFWQMRTNFSVRTRILALASPQSQQVGDSVDACRPTKTCQLADYAGRTTEIKHATKQFYFRR